MSVFIQVYTTEKEKIILNSDHVRFVRKGDDNSVVVYLEDRSTWALANTYNDMVMLLSSRFFVQVYTTDKEKIMLNANHVRFVTKKADGGGIFVHFQDGERVALAEEYSDMVTLFNEVCK